MEMQLERKPPRKPLIRLPRGLPSLELFIEVAVGVAGCVVCDRPIQQGLSRIAMRVRLTEPVAESGGKFRHTETYYAHVGCLTDRIRPEIPRMGVDCWDCGAQPTHGGEVNPHARFAARCFTTSKFAFAALCAKCTAKPRWGLCQFCQIHYPIHMISEAAAGADAGLGIRPYSLMAMVRRDYGLQPTDVAPGDRVCGSCADRFAIATRASEQRRAAEADVRRREWEIRRRQVLEQGVL